MNYLRVIDNKTEEVEKEIQMNLLQVKSCSYQTSQNICHYIAPYMSNLLFSIGYDFLTTSQNGLEMNIWYNSTYNNNTAYVEIALLRVPRLVNMVHL